MSSDTFNKENLDVYLKDLGKEFRKLNGKKTDAEIILIGGAAILVNYGFRCMTTDVDAIIQSPSAIKDAITRVGDKYNLPYRWLNDDFLQTDSYSSKLIQYSKPYRIFSNALRVRTVAAEYLVAMKLRAGRKYKHDLSDVVGILSEHEKLGSPITMTMLDKAIADLYGGWEEIPEHSKSFIKDVFRQKNYDALYASICEEEQNAKDLLVDFEENYPKATTQANVNDILTLLQEKKKQPLNRTIQESEKRLKKQNSKTPSSHLELDER